MEDIDMRYRTNTCEECSRKFRTEKNIIKVGNRYLCHICKQKFQTLMPGFKINKEDKNGK
jgi:transposase-like protein